MIQQLLDIYLGKKKNPQFKKIHAPQYSLQLYLE